MEAKINPTRTQKRIQKRMKISLILEKEFGSETWDSFDFKHQNELISARIAENRKNKNKLRAEKQKQKRFSIAKELKKKIGASAWKNLSPEEREKKIDIEIADRKESAKKRKTSCERVVCGTQRTIYDFSSGIVGSSCKGLSW